MLLSASGHTVRTVAHADRVLAEAVHPDVDMVIVDVAMPGGMDGLDVTRALRADPTTGFRPILMISARSTEIDLARGHEAGADDYLVKPFGPDELLGRVHRLLDSASV